MAISYRASAKGQTSSTGQVSFSVPVPTGTVNGDVMVAVVSWDHSTATVATPSGWTLIGHGQSTFAQMSTYYRVAASEPASYTWSFGSTSLRAAGVIVSWSGADTANPIETSSMSPSAAQSTTIIAPSVTTTRPDRVMAAFQADGTNATITLPTGLTERQRDTIVPALVVADFAQASPGATGDLVATSSATGYNLGTQIALRAAQAPTNVAYFNGTAWVDAIRSVYDGAAWVNHSPQVF